MKVKVLYFAVLRERLRRDEETIDLEDAATVADALDHLGARHETVRAFASRLQVAVNQQVVPTRHHLSDGDELALLPPVAGGAGLRIAVLDRTLSLDEVTSVVGHEGAGGLVTFTGVVRRQGQTPNVIELQYEAYIPMATQVLTAIADEIEGEWPGARVAIHHRVGSLAVGESAVVIAVSAPHRAAAFAGCQAAIDRLKERAPIWKKEIDASGATWIGSGP